MGEVMIALRAPVAVKTVESWVEQRVERLREAAWSSGVRLGRLWPAWQAQGADWLIEVDIRDRAVRPEEDLALDSVVREMALLGLRPQLLVSAPQDSSATAHTSAASTEAPARRGAG